MCNFKGKDLLLLGLALFVLSTAWADDDATVPDSDAAVVDAQAQRIKAFQALFDNSATAPQMIGLLKKEKKTVDDALKASDKNMGPNRLEALKEVIAAKLYKKVMEVVAEKGAANFGDKPAPFGANANVDLSQTNIADAVKSQLGLNVEQDPTTKKLSLSVADKSQVASFVRDNLESIAGDAMKNMSPEDRKKLTASVVKLASEKTWDSDVMDAQGTFSAQAAERAKDDAASVSEDKIKKLISNFNSSSGNKDAMAVRQLKAEQKMLADALKSAEDSPGDLTVGGLCEDYIKELQKNPDDLKARSEALNRVGSDPCATRILNALNNTADQSSDSSNSAAGSGKKRTKDDASDGGVGEKTAVGENDDPDDGDPSTGSHGGSGTANSGNSNSSLTPDQQKIQQLAAANQQLAQAYQTAQKQAVLAQYAAACNKGGNKAGISDPSGALGVSQANANKIDQMTQGLADAITSKGAAAVCASDDAETADDYIDSLGLPANSNKLSEANIRALKGVAQSAFKDAGKLALQLNYGNITDTAQKAAMSAAIGLVTTSYPNLINNNMVGNLLSMSPNLVLGDGITPGALDSPIYANQQSASVLKQLIQSYYDSEMAKYAAKIQKDQDLEQCLVDLADDASDRIGAAVEYQNSIFNNLNRGQQSLPVNNNQSAQGKSIRKG